MAFCEFINQTLTESVEDGTYAAAWESTAGSVQPEVPALPEFQPCS